MLGFLHFGIIDIIDILIVAFLFYQFYILIRKTAALKIFYVIIGVYFIWVLVKALHLELLSTILGHIMGVGVIAILIVFQQEVRRFLLVLGSKSSENLKLNKFPLIFRKKKKNKIPVNEIVLASEYLMEKKIGALIIISERGFTEAYYDSGQRLNSDVNSHLIETVFFKNTPLHDGAMFIVQDKIIAAGCVLPLTERTDLPYYLGLRHRAAIGITEQSDGLAIIISEERGQISFAEYGKIFLGVELRTLKQKINQKFYPQDKK